MGGSKQKYFFKIGDRFGRLTVLGSLGSEYICGCACGGSMTIPAWRLNQKTGGKISCGCLGVGMAHVRMRALRLRNKPFKFCPKCKKDKLREEFYNSGNATDIAGKAHICKECTKLLSPALRQRQSEKLNDNYVRRLAMRRYYKDNLSSSDIPLSYVKEKRAEIILWRLIWLFDRCERGDITRYEARQKFKLLLKLRRQHNG